MVLQEASRNTGGQAFNLFCTGSYKRRLDKVNTLAVSSSQGRILKWLNLIPYHLMPLKDFSEQESSKLYKANQRIATITLRAQGLFIITQKGLHS